MGKQAENKGNLSESELEEILTSNSYNTKGTLSNNGEESILEKTLTSSDGKYTILVSEIYPGPLTNVNPGGNKPKEKSYVGYYADVDADGTVDGIIYADLAIGKTGNGDYTIPVIEGTKDYYVSQTGYEGAFGTNDVLSPTGTGKERFYIMALTEMDGEIDSTHYSWYYNAENYDSVTSTDFGTGKSNSDIMIDVWNDERFGEQNDSDLWGDFYQVEEGWFIPSKDELEAFVGELGLTEDNCTQIGYQYESPIHLWSSSIVEDMRNGFVVSRM